MLLQLDRLLRIPSEQEIAAQNRSRQAFAELKGLVPFPDRGITYTSATLASSLNVDSSRVGIIPKHILRLLDEGDGPLKVNCLTPQEEPDHEKTIQLAQGEGGRAYPSVGVKFDSRGFDLSEVNIHHTSTCVTILARPRQNGFTTETRPEFLAGVLEALAADVKRGRERWMEGLNASRHVFMEGIASRLGEEAAVVNVILNVLPHSLPGRDFLVAGFLPREQEELNGNMVRLAISEAVTDLTAKNVWAVCKGWDSRIKVKYTREDYSGRGSGRLEIISGNCRVLLFGNPVEQRGDGLPTATLLLEADFAHSLAGIETKSRLGFNRHDAVLLLKEPNQIPFGPLFENA